MLLITEIQDSKIEDKNLAKFNNCRVFITVEKFYPKRSPRSNRFYWAVITEIVDRLSEITGEEDKNSIHESLKELFLKTDATNIFTGEETKRVKSTKKLTSLEFSEYLDKVIKFVGESYGIYIMTPEEYYET